MVSFERVKKFIENWAYSDSGDVLPNTGLNRDLLIVGDDAYDLLEGFSKEFDVDFSGMIFTDYFPEEATADMQYYLLSCKYVKANNWFYKAIVFCEMVVWGGLAEKKKFKLLTANDLWKAASKGFWEEGETGQTKPSN